MNPTEPASPIEEEILAERMEISRMLDEGCPCDPDDSADYSVVDCCPGDYNYSI